MQPSILLCLILALVAVAQHDFSHIRSFRKVRDGARSALEHSPLGREKLEQHFGRFGLSFDRIERNRKAFGRRHERFHRKMKGKGRRPDSPGRRPHFKRKEEEIEKGHENSEIARASIFDLNSEILPYLYGGDMVLSEHQVTQFEKEEDEADKDVSLEDADKKEVSLEKADPPSRRRRGAPIINLHYWNISVPISYTISTSITDAKAKEAIRKATMKIAFNTCINFLENGATTQTKLEYFKGQGCYSSLGKMNKDQQISIGEGCGSVGIISHETMHALGIDHTQTRSYKLWSRRRLTHGDKISVYRKDRDNFVEINADSIKESALGNFEKNSEKANDNFGISYDYGSIMHYGAFEFSSSSKPALVPEEIGFADTMGQRLRVSFNDYKMINALYNCSSQCHLVPDCKNGGYPNPRNCSRCFCGDFFDGDHCENQRHAVNVTTTRNITFATEYDQTLNKAADNTNFDLFTRSMPTIVKVPEGRKLNVTFNKIYGGFGQLPCYAMCPFYAVEIVDGRDLNRSGERFCCLKDQGKTLIFSGNVVGFKAYASPGMPFEVSVSFTLI